MQGSQAYNQATSLLLAFESVPLLLAPSSLIWILAPVPREITVIETLLARCTAFALLLLAFLTLLLSGELGRIWVAAGRLEDESVDASHAHANSYETPTLIATMLYHICIGMTQYIYSSNVRLSSTFLSLGAVLHTLLAAGAMLLLMFGKGGQISKRTGADKRTSGFPFRNAEADKKRIGKSR